MKKTLILILLILSVNTVFAAKRHAGSMRQDEIYYDTVKKEYVVGADLALSTGSTKSRVTTQGEYQMTMTNYSGHTSIRGELIVNSLTYDFGYTTAGVTSHVPCGVVGTGGVAHGEVGHCMESVASGTNELFWGAVHFR